MKNKLLLFLCLLSLAGIKAQNCSSAIQLTVNTGSTPLDSTNLSKTYYKFTATNTQHAIKFWIKGSNSPINISNIIIYNDSCNSLSTNIINSSSQFNEDTLYLDIVSLTVGNNYLIELNNPNNTYLINRISIANNLLVNTIALSCPSASVPCQGTKFCDLICNGGFECLQSPVTYHSGITTNWVWNWNCPTSATADIFSTTSSTNIVSVPCNFGGFQNAHIGNNYAGVAYTNNSSYSEYIQTKLTSALIAGQQYKLTFYVSKGENSNLGISSLSAFLTNTLMNLSSLAVISNTPIATETNMTLLNDMVNWQKITMVFNASGGEQYLILGRSTIATLFSTSPSYTCSNQGNSMAYIYIDDVSLEPNTTSAIPTVSCNVPTQLNLSVCSPPNTSFFSWNPAVGLSNPNILNPIITLSNTTTYTLTQTVLPSGVVNTYPITFVVTSTLNVTATPSLVCPGGSILLSATSSNAATTYTWYNGFGFFTGPNITVNPSATTIYTVVGSISGGCSSSNTVIANASNSLIVTPAASSSNLCAGSNATLSATSNNGATTYTWYPGGIVGSAITVSPLVTTIYTLTGATPGGCNSNNTITINVSTNTLIVNTTISTANTCPGGNVTLWGSGNEPATTYTWFPGGLVGATQIVNPLTTTIYTVIGTSPAGCMAQASTTVNVYPNNPSFTFTVSNPFVCLPNNSSTITITNTVTNVVFVNDGSTNFLTYNPFTLAPNVTTNYTITSNNQFGCATSQTFQIGVVDCACLTPAVELNTFTGFNIGYVGIGPFLLPFYAPYNVSSNMYFTGTLTFSNCEIRMLPNTEIRVANNGTLTIIGSHLYACGAMWKGIVVEPGGVLNIINSSTKSSFIEDAYVAVDVVTFTASTVKPNIVTAQNVIFNRNQIGIRITDFKPNQTTYPFTIQNCLFTSRAIASNTLTWPLVATVKNGASGNTSPLLTPFINSTTYPTTTLKSPLSLLTPSTGIVLNNVGFTNSNGNVWRNIAIGNSSNINNFNCFDNLREDIRAENSNVLITNNVFQNGVRYNRQGFAGAKGIVANSTTINYDVLGTNNNQILIQSVGSTTNLGNRFYEKTAAADITGYINTIIQNNSVYSFGNTYSNFNGINPVGDHGFSLKTNRYYNMTLQRNALYNIKNAMLISLDNGIYNVGVQAGNGRLVGNIAINTNTVNRHPVTAVASEFVNIALSIADPFAAASTTIIGGGSSSNAIYSNRFTNVHNGISVANIGFSAVNITTNTIGMVNEPNTIVANPIQNGILVNQIARPLSINQNSITGATSYSAGVKGISTSLNGLLSVQCNTTASLARGIEFNQGQAVSVFEDNRMQNQTYGLVLDNNAVLTTSVLGTTTRPTNNVWLAGWTIPNYKTFTTGGSSAQNGKMYIEYGNPQLDPANSASTTGNFATDKYDYISTTPVTLLNASTIATIGCRIGSGGGGGSGSGMASASSFSATNTNAQQVMEQMVSNAITYTTDVAETQSMNKILTYHGLKAEPTLQTGNTVLTNFYTNAQTNNLQKAVAIEDDLSASNLTSAQSKISNYVPTDNIETNYKNYYAIYLKTKTNAYTATDSLNLVTMANTCPYTNGGVVYQARALYNIYYTGYFKFVDNCASFSNNSRLVNNIASSNNLNSFQNNVNVILKSKLYPNPNIGEFSIELTNKVEQTNVEICIFDNSGKQFIREQKQVVNGVVNCNYNLLNGTYLVKVIMQDGSVDVHRLIISK